MNLFFSISMWAGIIGVIIFIILGILMVSVEDIRDSSIPIILILLCVACAIVWFACMQAGKDNKRKMLVASGQSESVQDVINQEEKLAQEREEARAQQQKAEADRIYRAQHPQCPACHGNNTRRISTTKRVVSTSVVGLASSTIGKQYECLDCKHKW